jgi:hypothetical protein
MAKRSPWATKIAKKERVALREKYGQVRLPENIPVASSIIRNHSSMSEEELLRFVSQHKHRFRDVLVNHARESGVSTKNINGERIGALLESGLVKGGALRDLAIVMADNMGKDATKRVGHELKKNVEKYLRGRKLPFNGGLVSLVVMDYVATVRPEELFAGRINLAKIENHYIRLLKEERTARQRFSEINNKLIRAALQGLGVSNKKVGVARRWVEREHEKYAQLFERRIKETIQAMALPQEEITIEGRRAKAVKLDGSLQETLGKISKEIWELEKKDLREFVISTMPKLKKGEGVRLSNGNGNNSARKIGSREQRMTEYGARSTQEMDEVVSARQNAAKLESAKMTARTVGTRFDDLGYCLREIEKTNPNLSVQMRSMLKQGTLKQNSVIQLFSNGNLAQRTFSRAINEFKFIESYGPDKVESLARMIYVIGPRVPRIDNVRKSINPRDSALIFDFLVKTGLANPNHRGGKCVMLARAKY